MKSFSPFALALMAAFGLVAADPSASECAVSFFSVSIQGQRLIFGFL